MIDTERVGIGGRIRALISRLSWGMELEHRAQSWSRDLRTALDKPQEVGLFEVTRIPVATTPNRKVSWVSVEFDLSQSVERARIKILDQMVQEGLRKGDRRLVEEAAQQLRSRYESQSGLGSI